VPVHGCHDTAGIVGEGREERFVGIEERLHGGGSKRALLVEIGARAERARAGAGDDHRAHAARLEVRHGVEELRAHPARHHVERRVVDDERAHEAVGARLHAHSITLLTPPR
jgi:hypothetical protein